MIVTIHTAESLHTHQRYIYKRSFQMIHEVYIYNKQWGIFGTTWGGGETKVTITESAKGPKQQALKRR